MGVGLFPVTVLDQANAMATFAAGGVRADAHFVVQVRRGGETIYGETLPSPDDPHVFDPDHVADLTYALTRESGQDDLAIKAGEWEFGADMLLNAQAWSVGYTSELAVAVWVGNKGAEQPLYDASGTPIYGAGLPTEILRQVAATAQREMGLTPTPFPPPAFTGSDNPPGSYSG